MTGKNCDLPELDYITVKSEFKQLSIKPLEGKFDIMAKMTKNAQALVCKIMFFYENNLTNGASFVFVLPVIACEGNRN